MSDFHIDSYMTIDEMIETLTGELHCSPHVLLGVFEHVLHSKGTYRYDCFVDNIECLNEDQKQNWRKFMAMTLDIIGS